MSEASKKLVEVTQLNLRSLSAGFLLGFIFDPEDVGDVRHFNSRAIALRNHSCQDLNSNTVLY
jgi:hypothetical protein